MLGWINQTSKDLFPGQDIGGLRASQCAKLGFVSSSLRIIR